MNKSKRLVSILAGIMAAVMLLTLLVGILPVSASAKSSSEIKEELKDLKGDRSEIRDQLKELAKKQDKTWDSIEDMVAQKDNIDQQIGLLYIEMDNINRQVRTYTELIAANQEELDAAELTLAELNEKNKERIRAMEEEGEITFWSVFFKAKSFADLIDRLNMMKEIEQADQRRMNELSEAAAAVVDARNALQAEKDALEESRAALRESQAELDAKRAEAESLLAELNADKRAMDLLEAEYEDEEAKLSAEIAAAEVEYTKVLKEEEAERKRREEEERKKREEEAAKNPAPSNPSNGTWGRPCSWRKLTSPFGYRTHPTTGQWKFHNGVDLANDQGTPIYAVRSGTVTVATYGSTYGYYVTINHGDGFSSLYAHMTHYKVSKGQYVEKGQLIGYMGSTGRSTGPHLHFSIFYNGSAVNPMNYI